MQLKWILISFLCIVLVSLGGAYGYNIYQQKVEFNNWLSAVEQNKVEKIDTDWSEKVAEEEVVTEEDPNSFWNLNKDIALSVSNEEFQKILDGDSNHTVLDARENLENAYGKLPGSIHIRYADLLNDGWKNLPTDQIVYVLCWSGMRGEEVAQFLRSKGVVAVYLVDGADGWVSDFGGLWEGSIKFSSVYSGYETTYTTSTTRTKVSEGVVLVDAREQSKIDTSPIDAVPMPLMETPSDELEAMFAQVPAGSKVITICDEWINCFMAKLVGVELEIRGVDFLGRYNSPWEW